MEELTPKILSAAPLAAFLCAVLLLEGVAPYFTLPGNKLAHGLRNGSLAVPGALIQALLFAGLTPWVMAWSGAGGIGLLNAAALPAWGAAALAFLLFDFWMYIWHRANHRVKLLWLFHRAHHNDTAMDVTTALRFHPVEITASSTLRLGVFALLGMRPEHLALYAAVMLPVILFQHGNIALPESLDRALRLVVASPAMHRVHHSREPGDYNSNYGSVFSFWDRAFGSFRLRPDPRGIEFGLNIFREERWQTVAGMLRVPLK